MFAIPESETATGTMCCGTAGAARFLPLNKEQGLVAAI